MLNAFRNRLYYLIKPVLPKSVRMGIRRLLARRKREKVRDIWPILPGSERPPKDWPGWPDGKKFAVVLTHDVEGQSGLDKCPALMRMEAEAGFRSSFNFIPEGGYTVPVQLREELVQNGFEVAVHDLHHNGHLYISKNGFSKKAARINRYLRDWNAVGFRSGFMMKQNEWMHELNVAWEATSFDTDPFEPQPEGLHTIFPSWRPNPNAGKDGRVPGYVDLPYTLPQDSTLFLLLNEHSPEIWLQKLDWIAAHGGMVLMNTHPDYMDFENLSSSETYPVGWYKAVLDHIRTKYSGQYWHGRPAEMAALICGYKDHPAKSPLPSGKPE